MARSMRTGSLKEIAWIFLRLGVIGFGGPAAHISMMEDTVVHRRKWVKREHFLDALSVTNMVPGPNSSELAIHVGYLRAGVIGGLVSGLCFILPAFLLMLVLSWAYFEFGSVPEVIWLFYGVKPAIIAIIAATAFRLYKPAVTDWPQRILAAAALAVTVVAPALAVAALIVAGLIGIGIYSKGSFRFPGTGVLAGAYVAAPMVSAASLSTLLALAWVFLKAGALLFGGGFVIIPLIEHEVVDVYGWLSAQQFIDGVAIGQATPGPIVITAAFVGYAAVGLVGAAVATAAIFLPAFVIVLAGTGPYLERIRGSEMARAFLKGTNAAVIGTIVGAGVLLTRSAVVDLPTGLILVAASVALVRFGVGAITLIGSAAAIGIALALAGVAAV